MLKLTQEDLSQAYVRASQIVQQQSETTPAGTADSEYEAYLSAAEETGIPRQAMLQALRERYLLPAEGVAPDDLVFAPSADKGLYAAKVLRVEGDSLVVKFLTGGEQTITATDVRPLSLVPGREVEFEYSVVVPEMHGIWHAGKISEYDSEFQQATISYGMTPYTVPLAKLRLRAQKAQTSPRVRDLLVRAVLITSATAGALGFLLEHFLRW